MMYDLIFLSLQHKETLLVWREITKTVHCTISVRWIVPLGLSLFWVKCCQTSGPIHYEAITLWQLFSSRNRLMCWDRTGPDYWYAISIDSLIWSVWLLKGTRYLHFEWLHSQCISYLWCSPSANTKYVDKSKPVFPLSSSDKLQHFTLYIM